MLANKKILHIIQSLDGGGFENILLRTLPLLTKYHHEIITLKQPGMLAHKLRERGIRVTDIKSPLKLISAVTTRRPSLVITYMFHADLWGRLLLLPFTNFRVISFLGTTYNYIRYYPAILFEKLTSFWVKEYISNSPAIINFYENKLGIKHKKYYLIPNGIAMATYKTDANLRHQTRQNLKIPATAIMISCVANLLPNKGHTYLLQAFETVFAQYPDIWLVLAGDGRERQVLQDQIKSYRSKTHILFLGYVSGVAQVLNASDIFVLPTYFEGMSNALMEAMAAGLAIITTDIPENRVLITHGQNGLLYRPKDHRELSLSLTRLVSDPRLRTILSQAARQTIKKNYDLKHVLTIWNYHLNRLTC